MIATHALRWILTVLFTAVSTLSAARTLRPGVPRSHAATERVTHTLHALMGVAMALMVWHWGAGLPVIPQAVFFALAAAWFLVSALLRGQWVWRGQGEDHPRTHAVLHALMMGAMAWMLLAMREVMTSAPSSSGGAGSVGGMSMELHGTSRTVAVVLLVVFVLLGLWWLAWSFDAARLNAPGTEPDQRGDSAVLSGSVDAGCHGAMALGMAVMLLVMV